MATLSSYIKLVSVLYAVVSVPSFASAELANEGVLNETLAHFKSAALAWTDVAQQAAERLFWALAILSLLWTATQLLLSRAELGDIVRELCQFMMFTGFWAWMMRNGPTHAGIIIRLSPRMCGRGKPA